MEIDTTELKYKYKQYDYRISDRCVKDYVGLCNSVFYEGDPWSKEVYNRMIQLKDNNIYYIESKSIGADIYEKIACNIE